MEQTLCSAFIHGIVRVRHSLSLLLLWTLGARLEPNMLKNLHIIPSRTSQNFYLLFLFYSQAPSIIPYLFYCVNDNITMQDWLYRIAQNFGKVKLWQIGRFKILARKTLANTQIGHGKLAKFNSLAHSLCCRCTYVPHSAARFEGSAIVYEISKSVWFSADFCDF